MTGFFYIATHREGLRTTGLGCPCDRLLKAFCSDKEFSVVTENPGIWDFPYRDMELMLRQCTVEACSDRVP